MNYKLYFCGGAVRDQFLGLKPKDIDYSVVIDPDSINTTDMFEIYNLFVSQIKKEGYEVFLETPDCLTVRCKFPKSFDYRGGVDLVIARKELKYIENTRTPVVKLGTMRDDLYRRDYRINAMARDMEGNLYDPFDGRSDLNLMSLNTPGDPNLSFKDDPLRIIRGMRFCITKGFTFCRDVRNAITEIGIGGMEVVSEERIREEMHKCFHHDTHKTLKYLNYMEDTLRFPIRSYIFDNTKLWLKITNEK